jgi:hypothetical protein
MSIPELFSRRGKTPGSIKYDLPQTVRNRILLVLKRYTDTITRFRQVSFREVMRRIEDRLTERYGDFTPPLHREVPPAVQHFIACNDEQALDFIEAIFTSINDTGIGSRLVDEFNQIFRQEAIGYELTPMTDRVVTGGGALFGHTVDAIETTYPIIRKRGDTPQDESMTECLHLLTDPTFKVANEQFLKAHQHFRASEWDQAIAYCGSAFESVLKAALDKKRVTFKKDATANVLILECVKAGIFPQTYENSLIGIANVRNAMSDTTHGRTPTTQIVSDQKNAEHLLYVTAANITFISRCV